MNALTPSLDATSLEIFEVLVRGSGQLLISNVKKCEPVKVGESASQSEEIIEIDDFDNSAVSGAADQCDSDHADAEDYGVLRKGMKGDGVRIMQKALGISADGIFGPGTEKQLKAWQSHNGLTADGICGPATFSKLLDD